MVNDSLELSVIFVPLVLPEPMGEVFFFQPRLLRVSHVSVLTRRACLPGGAVSGAEAPSLRDPARAQRIWLQPAQPAGAAGPVHPSGGRGLSGREGGSAVPGQDSAGTLTND